MPLRLLIVLLVALLASCAATPPHQALPAAMQAQKIGTEVIVGLPQRELAVQRVDAKAKPDIAIETGALPLRRTLARYDFDNRFRTALDRGLARAPRLAARPARLLRANDDISYAAQLAASPAAAVLLLDLDYALTPDFANLEISARPRLMPRSAALRERAGLKATLPKQLNEKEALYRNRILFRSRLPTPGVDRVGNGAQWLIDEGYPLQEALSDGIDEIVAALVEDLLAKPGTTTTGPALTDGYWRRRAPDGTIDIAGRAGTGRSLMAEPLRESAPPVAAPVAIPEPPPEPIAPGEPAEPLSDAGMLGSAFPPPVLAAPPSPPAPPAPPALSYDASPPSLQVSPRLALPAAATQIWHTRLATALYERPMLSSAVVARLARGIEVEVRGRTLNTTGEWLFLKAGGESGWARGEDIEIAQ